MSLVQIGQVKTPPRDLASPGQQSRADFAKIVVAVTSGKGGVGKSTLAVNLAVGCAQRGLKVGLLDADVYGPSVARMLQVQDERMQWNDADKIVPAENFGVKTVSTAMATPESDSPLAWRASVATSALVQLLEDVEWGDLDVLFVDMPPGTGDVQITIAQETVLTYAVVVTTPQQVATDDVARAIRMFHDLDVAVGVVENMSYFEAPDTGLLYHPFGQGGGATLAERYGIRLLAELPLRPEVTKSSDDGIPDVVGGGDKARAQWHALLESLLSETATPETEQGLSLKGEG